jgi:hypothetical protein
MSLQQWLVNGWLRAHKATRDEIRELVAVADRDLANCSVPGLGADWQLNIAYNAALQLAVAALAAAGYRPERESHRYRALQSLRHTIGMSEGDVARLDGFRKKRNISDYERAHTVSDQEAEEMKEFARRLRREVEAWIRASHPGLL